MNNYSTKFSYLQVNSKQIVSDNAYQRRVDSSRVKAIITRFDPDLVNPIKVSFRDGKYYVFDGQHTLTALKARNGDQDLDVACKVYYGLTQREEAILFSQQNGLSRNVKINAKMKALYTAGDVEIIELHKVVHSLGMKLDFTEASAPYKIVACGTLLKIFQKTSEKEFRNILMIIREAWNGDSESFNKEILAGMYEFYRAYKEEIGIEKAIEQFSKVSPRQIIREGKSFQEGGDKRFARQLVTAYNKNLRRGKLKELI